MLQLLKKKELQMETWRSAECKRLVKEECPSPSSRIPDNVVVEWSPPRSEGLAEALSSPSPLETDEIDPKKNSIAALMGMSGQSRRHSSLSDSQILLPQHSPRNHLPLILSQIVKEATAKCIQKNYPSTCRLCHQRYLQ